MRKFTFVFSLLLMTLLSFQTVNAQTGDLLAIAGSEFPIVAYGENYAAKAYDGNVNTHYWSGGSTVAGSTFKLWLNNVSKVNEIKLVFADGDRTSAADVEVSADGNKWTKVGGFTNGTELSEYTCDANGAVAKYVRLKIVTPNGTNWFKICEFQVYGVELYKPNFTGTKGSDRPLNGISLNGSELGDYSLSLTNEQKLQLYVDATTTVFSVYPGEVITPVTSYGASWMHSYVYVDADKNGFTALVDEGDGYTPLGDLVSYSTYNADPDGSGQWRNSAGTVVNNGPKTVELPSFTAPATPGVYRMRYKIDWNSIDPAGCSKEGNTLKANRGTIVDVILNVVDYSRIQFENAYIKAESILDEAYVTNESKVSLQVENPNADNYIWCNVPDPSEGGIGYLIDGQDGAYGGNDFFHSSWHASLTAPLHYLQVDMGEGKSIDDFYFAYHTRNYGGGSDFPKEIQIMGSNNKDANFVEIANITGLPQSANTDYKSSLIKSVKSYRYIRFNIKAPRTYWHMAEFELIRFERPFAELTDKYTEQQTDIEAIKALYAETYKNYEVSTVEAYETATAAILAPIYNLCKKIADPADFENGKVYTFVTSRGWMGAKNNNDKLISTAYILNGVTGRLVDPYFQWTVYKSPKNHYYLYNIGKGMYMGVEKRNNTAVPFSAQPAATTLTFKTSGNATYPIMFSTDGAGVVNHSGSHASGLINWTGGWNNLNDDGSNHQVAEVDDISLELLTKITNEVAHFEALTELNAAIASADAYIATYVGTEYGKYSSSDPDAATKYAAIKAFRDAVTATTPVADIESKTAELTALVATFTLNVPAAKSYVRIAYDFGGDTLYVQGEKSNVSGKANSPIMTAATDAASIFYFGDSTLLSYTEGLYLKEDGGTRGLQAMNAMNPAAAAGKASFEAGSVVGTLAVKVPAYMHANTSGEIRFIDHCGGAGHAEHNMIVEAVTELPVTVTAAGYASFYAPVALEIPEGVEVFYATKVNGDYVSLVKIEGVIPAETGVIIKATANTYNFVITGDVAAIEGNIFQGTVNKKVVAKGSSSCYVLGIKDGNVGMYNAVNGSDETTFINAGHKAYMCVEGAANSAGYRFDFDGTTGITEVETENTDDAVIYDLTGRRVQDMNRAGIYIVNGKKVLVK